MTANARRILDIIKCSDHPTAEDIYLDIRSRGIKISPATVYNNLAALCDEGKICKLPEKSGAVRYDNSIPHGHLICSKCGKIKDLFIDDFSDFLSEKTGQDIDAFDLRVYYTCPDCK